MTDARIQKILRGADKGVITDQEANALLQAEFNVTLEQARAPKKEHGVLPYAVAAGFILILAAIFYLPGSGFAGLAVFDIPQEELSTLQNVTQLTASGTLWGEGSARILFETGNSTLLIAEIHSDTGEPQTTKASYTLGENVTIENTPENATFYFDNTNETLPVDIPFPAQEGDLLIVTTATTHHVPVLIGQLQRETTFQNVCEETCTLLGNEGTIRIETVGNATLDMRIGGETDEPNNAPELMIPYVPQIIEETVTINLSGHFIDRDGDFLLYSTGLSDIVTTEIDGTLLTLAAIQPGTEELIIYSSDMTELVQTTMEITVPGVIPEPEEVVNTTVANMTIVNTTVVNTTQIVNNTPDCSAGDPNTRPVDCLTLQSETYFEQPIYWESVSRARVAKFTTIGNLLITGNLIENSGSTPNRDDFKVIRKDANFNEIGVAWVDENGNLHLKGRLYEEQHSVQPPPGSYSVINRRGVYLAYIDKGTGDLFIRGNLILSRRSIE